MMSDDGRTRNPTIEVGISAPSSESEDFSSEVTPRHPPPSSIGSSELSNEQLQSDTSASDAEQWDSDSDYSYVSDGADEEEDETLSRAPRAESGPRIVPAGEGFVHPLTLKTKPEARAHLDGLENARFSVIGDSRFSTRLSCTTHVDCTAKARIKKERNGQFHIFRSGVHTAETVDIAAQRSGIHKPLLSDIDNLLLGG
jgi:hypothetical protein